MKDIEGVYAIHNLVTGKKYIGQSVSIKNRWRKHLLELRNNRHHSKHLQHSFNKYGENVFIFGIIEECDYKNLTAREQYWINHFDSYNNGYNSVETSIKGGRLFSEEDKMIYRINAKVRWDNLSRKEKNRRLKKLEEFRAEVPSTKVTIYDRSTLEKISEFDSYRECAEHFKISIEKMRRLISKLYCENDTHWSWKNYIIIRESDSLEKYLERVNAYKTQVDAKLMEYRRIRKENSKPKKQLLSKEDRKKSWEIGRKRALQVKRDKQTKVLQIWDKEDNLITTVLTQKDAEKFTGVAGRYIDKVLRGDKKSYKGIYLNMYLGLRSIHI